MNTLTDHAAPQASAKIYQFPVRPRGAVTSHREGAATELSLRMSDALDNCWYHDAAVKQSAALAKI